MIVSERTHWEPLGPGRIAPAGSISDRRLAALLATHKCRFAGTYRSVAPDAITTTIPEGNYVVSPKIDGETWFLRVAEGEAHLLSPTGRVITGIPLTNEAATMGRGRSLLFAGELYADGGPGRPRVHDLHAALGGGEDAAIDRLRFAAFDLLEDGPRTTPDDAAAERGASKGSRSTGWRPAFPVLAGRIAELLGGGVFCHSVPFEDVCGPAGVVEPYDRLVTRGGHEGIVVRSANGSIYKIKPEITLDAAIVGFTERVQGGIAELLLALLRPDGAFLLLGRVDTGFTNADRQDLASRLHPLVAPAVYRAVARSGALFRFVRPEIVIEVKCNDILTARADGDPIRRMLLQQGDEGWQPLGQVPAASMVNAVFRRVRDDKPVTVDSVRISQVTDLSPVDESPVGARPDLAPSTILRREVLTKRTSTGTSVRKALLWKTNKEQVDPLYPKYVAFYSDFAPERQQPLQTGIRVGSTQEALDAHIDTWLQENRTRGWTTPNAAIGSESACGVSGASLPSSCFSGSSPSGQFRLDLTISFARTPSVNLAVAVRRIKALASAGILSIEEDDRGRPVHFELALRQDALVEHIRRIENLHRVISRWRGAEVAVNGDPLDLHDVQGVFSQVGEIAACWRRQCQGALGSSNPCRAAFVLGCRQIRIDPASGFPGLAREHPAWYAVGTFDGKRVALDKAEIRGQLDAPANRPLAICPFYRREEVEARLGNLPDHLDPVADPTRWTTGYSLDGSKPLWAFPKKIGYLPFGVTLTPGQDPIRSALESAMRVVGVTASPGSALPLGTPSQMSGLRGTAATPSHGRVIPSARYADVRGQDVAVESVRDYAELPLRHPELFEKVGVRPGRGILLWGPPGNGKTLLARAVAGESNAHIETINGPELFSKWVGETERQLREVFDRAGRLAPSVILMDELDAIAAGRDSRAGSSQGEVVSQLLVLMDGIHARGRVLVLGTTNRPERIDPALLRPGRLDRKVYVGPPGAPGRLAILEKLLAKVPLGDDVNSRELALATLGLSGAEIEHLVNEAGLLAVKDAIARKLPPDATEVGREHFVRALAIGAENDLAGVASPSPRRGGSGSCGEHRSQWGRPALPPKSIPA